VTQAVRYAGVRAGLTTDERECTKATERELKDLARETGCGCATQNLRI
jgi:hypothetical protein